MKNPSNPRILNILANMVYRVTNELEHGDQLVNATADLSDASVLECVEHANASVDVLGNIDASGPSESSTQFRSTVMAVHALSIDLSDRVTSVDREQSIGQPITAFLPLGLAACHMPLEVWLVVFAQIYHDIGYSQGPVNETLKFRRSSEE
ncbi:hypothetical protein ARMGADRAFT_1033955 [Armillaria gallica]|uniref:PDEase domain-containing protein n=1 Tax=Armillaria gallica TaxID=47427 RepID=A0A2H3D4C5_ARMGA|nr:hypothetical protein ARMGADRAFT_1033955 [Armillaria gallica]